MKLSKPKKKTIARIIAVISVILFCYYYSTIKTPYSSVQKIVSHLEKTEHAEILDTLSQKDVSIIYYKTLVNKREILKGVIVYKLGTKFYIDIGGSESKRIFEDGTFDYSISVRKMGDKYAVIVTNIFLENPNPVLVVKDNISSTFDNRTIKLGSEIEIAYLAVLEKLPENYIVTVNGIQISIN